MVKESSESERPGQTLAAQLIAAAGLADLPEEEMRVLTEVHGRFGRDRELITSQPLDDVEPAVQFNPASRGAFDE